MDIDDQVAFIPVEIAPIGFGSGISFHMYGPLQIHSTILSRFHNNWRWPSSSRLTFDLIKILVILSIFYILFLS